MDCFSESPGRDQGSLFSTLLCARDGAQRAVRALRLAHVPYITSLAVPLLPHAPGHKRGHHQHQQWRRGQPGQRGAGQLWQHVSPLSFIFSMPFFLLHVCSLCLDVLDKGPYATHKAFLGRPLSQVPCIGRRPCPGVHIPLLVCCRRGSPCGGCWSTALRAAWLAPRSALPPIRHARPPAYPLLAVRLARSMPPPTSTCLTMMG